MTKLIQLVPGLLLLLVLQVQAADNLPPSTADQPIEVTARQLEALQQQGEAIFTGQVVAKQGDITLYCDKLVVYSQQDRKQVDRLEAYGNVRVVQLDRTATGDKAVYRQQQGTLQLIGAAKVHQGQNQVTGDEITLYLRENRSIVKSGDGSRVRAILFPEPKQEKQ